jgi:thiol-disulfide isomerase/thioredoxin/tetratricopeptide (TPR) repeat protein
VLLALGFTALASSCAAPSAPKPRTTVAPASAGERAQESRLVQLLVRQEHVACLAQRDGAAVTDEERAVLAACFAWLREQKAADVLVGQIDPGSGWHALAEALVALARGEPDRALSRLQVAERSLSAPAASWLIALVHARLSAPDTAIRAIEGALERVKEPSWRAELLVLEADTLERSAEPGRRREVLLSALQEHEDSVRALVGLSALAVGDRDFERARRLAERAVKLAPRSWTARFAYWRAQLDDERSVPPSDWLASQAAEFGALVSDSALATFLLAEELRMWRADALALTAYEAVVARFPGSFVANEAHYRSAIIPAYNPGLRPDAGSAERLAGYLARPERESEVWRTDACLELFRLVARGVVPRRSPSLGELAECGAAAEASMPLLQRKNIIAMELAARPEHRELAQRLAREVMGALTDEQRKLRPNNILAGAHLALALIAAEQPGASELVAHAGPALELASSNLEVEFRVKLARQLLRVKRAAEAARFVEGCVQHPDCVAAASDAYRQQRGDLVGFERYLERTRERLFTARRQKVHATARRDRAPMPALELVDARGERAELPVAEALAIKFWSIDCAPCRWEMPEFQAFVTSTARSRKHVVVAVNIQDSPDRVRDWMAKHGYDFPVLFTREELPMMVPTTWFTDRERRLVFEVAGYQEKTWFEHENSWRLQFIAPGA